MLNRIKNWLIFCILVFVSGKISAQQLPQFTQTMFNKLSYNSGYAGLNKSICVGFTSRQQWQGFVSKDKDDKDIKVNPRTSVIAGDMYIKEIHGGIGLILITDDIGFENNKLMKFIYSYHHNMYDGVLGVGIDAQLNNKTIDFANFKAITESDPLLKSSGEEKNMMFDLGIGAYYRVENKYGFGLYGAQLLQKQKDIGEVEFQNKRHFYITGDYNLTIPNHTNFEIAPMSIIKTDLSTIQFEVNALLKYKKKIWAGLAYRQNDAIGVIVGLAYKDIRIGYSYDVTTSKLGYGNGRSGGSHEVTIGYCFKILREKLPESYKNVRFL